MSTLSKVFVVLNFLIAIAFMVASLTLYAKKIHWVQNAHNTAKESNAVKDELQITQKEYEEYQKEMIKKFTSADGARKSLQTQLEGKESDLEREIKTNAQLRADLQDIKTNIGLVETKLKDLDTRNRELQKAKDELQRERDQAVLAREFAEKQAIETVADLKEAEAELLELSKHNHMLVERVMQQDTLLDWAYKQGFEPKTVLGMGVVPSVTGRVLEVEEAVGIVILNVGEQNKVKTGMEFVISRGDSYVGKVRVRNIYKDMCSAIIDRKVTKRPIQVADLASTLNR